MLGEALLYTPCGYGQTDSRQGGRLGLKKIATVMIGGGDVVDVMQCVVFDERECDPLIDG
eukprot:scaffold10899_cov74-Isochrysis_galbana.AAC.2